MQLVDDNVVVLNPFVNIYPYRDTFPLPEASMELDHQSNFWIPENGPPEYDHIGGIVPQSGPADLTTMAFMNVGTIDDPKCNAKFIELDSTDHSGTGRSKSDSVIEPPKKRFVA